MSGILPGIGEAERLTAMVDDLAVRLAALPEASFTQRSGAEEWTAAEVVGHMTELMPYWAHRAVAIARQPGASWGRSLDDPDRVGAVRTANDLPRAEALARLRNAAHEAATVLASLNENDWQTTGMHTERGATTIAELVKQGLVEHAASHVRQALTAAGAHTAD